VAVNRRCQPSLGSPTASGPSRVARARRAKAHELIERLVAEGRVRLTDPDDDELAEWRRVVNYAKRHGLEPVGKRIEKIPYGGPGLELFLAEGPHPNAQSQLPKAGGSLVPVPARLGRLHPVVAALKDDESRLVMPSTVGTAHLRSPLWSSGALAPLTDLSGTE
jgi:hypothetical protein